MGSRRFALRRFAFVVKWAAVVIVVSGTGHQSAVVGRRLSARHRTHSSAEGINRTIHVTRWLLSGGLLLFCSVQIFLIFHNESLARALKDHFRLGRRYGGSRGLAGGHRGDPFFRARGWGCLSFRRRRVPGRGSGAAWSLFVYPLMWTALAGWFLTSWVCLFRRCERDRPDLEELVPF